MGFTGLRPLARDDLPTDVEDDRAG